jgi:hypothetical protein
MCCHQNMPHGHACGCENGEGACQCGQTGHFKRRFQTREEQIANLEQYVTALQAETQAVNEQIALLQAN